MRATKTSTNVSAIPISDRRCSRKKIQRRNRRLHPLKAVARCERKTDARWKHCALFVGDFVARHIADFALVPDFRLLSEPGSLASLPGVRCALSEHSRSDHLRLSDGVRSLFAHGDARGHLDDQLPWHC